MFHVRLFVDNECEQIAERQCLHNVEIRSDF